MLLPAGREPRNISAVARPSRRPTPVAGTIETPEAALARNVRLIAINPRNYDAQLAAGRAALRLGDPQAAIGFFGRAEEINADSLGAQGRAGLGDGADGRSRRPRSGCSNRPRRWARRRP